MLKIGIGLSYYEDFDSLRRMLMSCQSYPIDLIIAVDGIYRDYPAKNLESSQQVRDLFKGFQTPVIHESFPNLHQNAKRQVYFDLSKENRLDCLIVMDSDEYFIHDKTNWPLFMEDLRNKIANDAHTYRQAYCIPTYLKYKGIEVMPEGYVENLPRLFYKPWDLRYVDDHYTIRNKNTGVIMTYEGNSTLSHIAMSHDHTLRSKEYNARTHKYEDELVEYENSVRDKRRQDFMTSINKT